MSGLDTFPFPRREIARTALTAAFGSAQTESVTNIPSGATQAALYRVDRGGRAYVLRIEGTPSPLRNPHQYESLRLAAEAGIAPPVHYTDAVKGYESLLQKLAVAQQAFVSGQPLPSPQELGLASP